MATKFHMRVLLLCAATVCPAIAHAQDATGTTARQEQGEETAGERDAIVVTGSRIVRNGADMPTPVAVMTTEELNTRSPRSLPEALNILPQFRGSQQARARSTSSADIVSFGGGDYFNLRNLGANRNLVLLDGRRVPPTNSRGGVDANTLPQLLVERVDVVTAGASAVYGSDAVSGAINFVLDDDFDGVKAIAQSGVSGFGDGASYRLGAAFGMEPATGLRIIGSVEHYSNDGIGAKTKRIAGRGASGQFVPYATAGLGTAASPYFLVPNAHYSFATFGGYIANGALRGNTFLPNGSLTPFVGSAVSASLEQGGMGAFISDGAPTIQNPYNTVQTFGRLSYEISPALSVYAQGSYGKTEATFQPWNAFYFCPGYQCPTMFSDNAFLSDSAKSTLAAAGQSSFQLSRISLDQPFDYDEVRTNSLYLATGIEGKIGSALSWNINYSYGRSELLNDVLETQSTKFFAAVDAVRDTAGNIVCRVTITNPGLYPGCVPLNLFGVGAPSAAAGRYVQGHSLVRVRNVMNLVSANLSGTLLEGWAGPLSFAVGGEYRHQTLDQQSNANPALPVDLTGLRAAPGNAQHFMINNNGTATGAVTVKEAYVEAVMPLARDLPWARALELNGAARYTDYSTSGGVLTYKYGLIYAPIADVRFRGTISRDIRAPSLFELYAGRNVTISALVDPHTNTGGTMVYISQGNPDLDPEVGSTATAGVVFEPRFLPGLSASIDFYRIRIKGAVATLNGPTIVNDCEATNGTGPTCALIDRPLPYSDRTAANRPTSVRISSLNLSSQYQRGVDFDLSYRHRFAGDIGVSGRILISYLDRANSQQSATTATIIGAGYIDSERWRGSGSLTLDADKLAVTVNQSFVGPSHISATQVWRDNPVVPAAWYTDLDIRYDIGSGRSRLTPFLNVKNLFNKQAPLVPFFAANPGISLQTLRQKFDPTGIYFTTGVSFRY